MNANEMREKYWSLYDYMANSKDPKNMKIFGKVMTTMVEDMISSNPSKAEEYINKLESIKWNQFLTPAEADKIVANMQPKAPWSRDVWNNAMDSLGLVKEEEPFYNRCAMFVEMNKQYSDHAETISKNILKKPLSDIPMEQIVTGIHAMALDVLKDKDNVYNIRSYFGL